MSDRLVRRNPRVVFREIEDGGLLLHLDTTAYHRVNRTGALIWVEIGEGRTEGGIVAAVRREMSEAPAGTDDEIASYIEALESRDLIKVDSS
jgi:hypothetical protein